MKWIRAVLFSVLIPALLVLGTGVVLITTTPGVQLLVRITNTLLPGSLTVSSLEGHFFKTLAFKGLSYTDKHQSIALSDAKLKWHITSFSPLHLTLDTLEITQVDLSNAKQKITLERLNLRGAWRDGLHLDGGARITLPQGVLNARVTTEDDMLAGRFTLDKNHITVKGPVKGPWQIHAELLDLKAIEPALTPFKTTLIADATVYDMAHATLNARLTPGHYQRPRGSTPARIAFNTASLKAHLTRDNLDINGYWQLDDNTAGRLKLSLPKFRLNEATKATQPLDGKLSVAVNSLDFLDNLSLTDDFNITLEKPRGKLNAAIDISGVLEAPKFVGHLALTEGSAKLPDLGLTLNPIALQFKTDGTTWESAGVIQSNQGAPLNFTGKGTMTPSVRGSASLSGDKVIIMSTPQYYVTASPALSFTVGPDNFDIRGNILIPEAEIKPLSFIHTVRLTHDAVLINEKVDPNPLNLTSDITVNMGDNVKINTKGIQGNIDGSLHLTQKPKQPLNAVGTLTLRDGRYEAYGQKLEIEQGELIFLGQQVDNPNIRVRATRHFTQTDAQFSGSNQLFDFSASNLDSPALGNNTTVGITVTGRVDAPNVKLFSSPPNLSQTDILSMLLLGRPADQASQSGGQILLQAMTSLHLNSGSKGVKMLRDLQKSTGIDVNVENKSFGTESSDYTKTSFSIGKKITKRVYLKYNTGIFQQNTSVFTLTYLLNKFLSIKVTASDIGNGVDVTYSHSE